MGVSRLGEARGALPCLRGRGEQGESSFHAHALLRSIVWRSKHGIQIREIGPLLICALFFFAFHAFFPARHSLGDVCCGY